VYSFSATLRTAGNQTITATDTGTSSITGTSSPIAVGAAALTHFSVSTQSTATAGSAFSVTVTAQDAFNNTVTGYTGTVHFTTTDGGSGVAVPAGYTFVSGDNGVHTFTNGVTLVTAGNQTVTATDTVTSSISGTSAAVAVNAAAATQLAVSGPSSATAGTAFTLTVRAVDAFGNTATAYGGTVHFSSSDGAAALPADSTLTSGSSTFAALLRTAGKQTITATDTITGSITGTSNPIAVSPAALRHFGISVPSAATAGSAFSVTVTAQDAFNNTVTGYTDTVHFTTTDGGSGVAVPVDYTFVGGDNGVHTFSNGATLVTAGNQTVTATDTTTSSITGTSAAIGVVAAVATHFSVSAPSSVTAGSAFSVTVTALDAFGNTATTYRGTVHFTSSDSGSGSAIPADYTFVGGDNGAHTFPNGATFVTASTQTLTTTDTVTGSITGTSGAIAVVATAATHFSVSAPGTATAGTAFNITVTALDAYGNTATGYSGTIQFSSTALAASLPANSILTGGTGSFSATLKTSGNQTITATDTANANITGISNPISVSAAALDHFLLGVPALAITGSAFSFSVTAVDLFNNPVTSYGGTVHFTSSDSTATLPGNSTLTGGTGSFSATLNKSGSQTITATDTATSSLTGTSSPIAVLGLIVTSFTPTPTGFTVTFSKPFVNSSTSPVHLYDAASAGYGPADVTLVGSSAVKGSLLIDPSNTSFTFVKTDLATGGGTGGLLAAGTYTVTLVSGPIAFRDTTGAPLDGSNDGSNSKNYTTTFTVAPPTAVVVSVPDFARGPDNSHAINLANNTSNGIPITLSNGSGVTDGTFVLQYNANLLSITGSTVNSALSGATFTVTTSGSGTSAQATIVFHSSTALVSGAVRLGGLTATVPGKAPYKAKALLHFSSVSLNNGGITAVGDDGLQVVAFLDDTSGDGTYTSADSVLISRVASLADSGFAAFPVLDPAIVGDLNGDGRITAGDGGLLNNYLAGNMVAQMPAYPGAPSNNPSGPDPALTLPSALQVGMDGTVEVPVTIDDPHPAGSSGLTQAQLALTYDPTVLSVSAADIHLGNVPSSGTGWKLQSVVNSTTGQIGITLFSATPIRSSTGGSLVTLVFHVRPGAQARSTLIDLVSAVNPTGRRVVPTALDDNQGVLTLDMASIGAMTTVGLELNRGGVANGEPLPTSINRPTAIEPARATFLVAPPSVSSPPAPVRLLFAATGGAETAPTPFGGSLVGQSSATRPALERVFLDLALGVNTPAQPWLANFADRSPNEDLSSSPTAASPRSSSLLAPAWSNRDAESDWLQTISAPSFVRGEDRWSDLLGKSLQQSGGTEEDAIALMILEGVAQVPGTALITQA
jgi:hypothetical protein